MSDRGDAAIGLAMILVAVVAMLVAPGMEGPFVERVRTVGACPLGYTYNATVETCQRWPDDRFFGSIGTLAAISSLGLALLGITGLFIRDWDQDDP